MGIKYVAKSIKVFFVLCVVNAVVMMFFVEETQAKIDISKKQVSMVIGQKTKLKVTGTNKKVKWRSSNKKVARITKKGKIKAKMAGTTTITAKVNKKTLKCKVYVYNTAWKDTTKYIDEVAELVNAERRKAGIKELKFDYRLSLAAIERSKELVADFSHTRPNGEKCYSILQEYGFYYYSSRGEIIAMGYTTPKDVMRGWMGSQGHKERILDPDYRKMGIGFYFDKKTETCYWCQIFYRL